VTAENQDVLAGHMEELVRELRPDNVTINLARGDALDASLLEVDPERYLEVVAAKRRLQEEGVLAGYDHPLRRLAIARDHAMYAHVARVARGDRSRHLPCTAGVLSAVVFEDGSVHPCEILGKPLGNLREVGWDLARVWGSPAAAALRREIQATRCACTWECAQADNVLFNRQAWPGLVGRALTGPRGA
jgi:MoaA/NifB/PqqE/SkfB family radical SAM enzyme